MKIMYAAHSKCRVGASCTEAMKIFSLLMEDARRHSLIYGAGNQEIPFELSQAESHYRYEVTRSMVVAIRRNASFKQVVRKYVVNRLVTTAGKDQNFTGDKDGIQDAIATYGATTYLNGGNCCETADLIACHVLKNGPVNDDYSWVHRFYLTGCAHEICIIGRRSISERDMLKRDYILLDPWIPITQVCRFGDSEWCGDELDHQWSKKLDSILTYDAIWQKATRTAWGIKKTYEDRLKRYMKNGVSATLLWKCKRCKMEFTNPVYMARWPQDKQKGKSGKKAGDCPRCYDKLEKIKRKEVYYQLPASWGSEAFYNLALEPYENVSILSKGWEEKNARLLVMPYCSAPNERERAKRFWKKHMNAMRTYKWGVPDYDIGNAQWIAKKIR